MPPRGKGKKAKDAAIKEKKKELQKLQEFLKNQIKEYENYLNCICESTCANIRKEYKEHLQAIPENMRNMTISQIMELPHEENIPEKTSVRKVLQSHIERSKQHSDKKKTEKISRLERKRSLSVSVCSSGKYPGSALKGTFNRFSRTLSDTNIGTPCSKQSVIPAAAVTPKFNPNGAVNKSLMRKPRAGEILMSLSGSPLQNIMDVISAKPGVTLSLGGGKVINITADKEIEKLQSDFARIDNDTKMTLQNVKNKLDKMLSQD